MKNLTQRHGDTESWPKVRLGDVCEIEFGTRVRRKDSKGGEYPVYGGGGATFSWPTYNREDCCIVSRFAMSEECVRFVKGKFFLNDSGLSVQAKESDIDQDFLSWCLFAKQPDIYALGRGAAQKNLDMDSFPCLEIQLPPLSVQQEIVARLEKELAAVDRMVEGFEEMKAEADQLFKAELKETFEDIKRRGAETQRLGEVCEKIGSGSTPLGGKSTYVKEGVSLIRSQNVLDLKFSFNGLAHINDLQAEKLAGVTVREDDVLLNITGDSVARCCVVDAECLEARVNQHVAIIRIGDKARVLPSFVAHYLVSSKDFLLSEAQKGSTRKALTKSFIEEISLPMINLAEQRTILAKLDAVREKCAKLKSAAEEGLKTAALLRKAILKEVFE